MLKIRFFVLSISVAYLLLIAVQNNKGIDITLPLVHTFFNVPLFIIILISIAFGITLQFITSFSPTQKKKKK
jgi:uncharacterized integral membrane protein